jgi:DNA-binding NtrC family response regulator
MSISRTSSFCVADSSRGGGESDPSAASELGMIGNSAAMERLRLQVRRIGPHFRTVLIRGETGTGKELVARALHRMSSGMRGPLVVCHAAAPEDALDGCDVEGECRADPIGCLIRRAAGGTLFFDGVSEMPMEAQLRLLRELRRHEVTQSRWETQRGGRTATVRADVRVIASTGEDLRVLVAAGRFRAELYQRLAMVEITLPPLRERAEDIPALSQYFLDRFAMVYGGVGFAVSDKVVRDLQRYRWPGNVRELEAVLHNGVLGAEGTELGIEDLIPYLTEAGAEVPAEAVRPKKLNDVVQRHVLQVLQSCAGNKLRAAEALGISRSTLYRMLDAFVPAEGSTEG